MKKITAFVGSPRKKHTFDAADRFLNSLQAFGGVECEIVPLRDYKLETCKGCCTCFNKGESFCPLKDDRDLLIEKMMSSDGVVFASPNYSFQVSAMTKTFLDRLGFVFHRPRFFGKTFTSIVVQGIRGGPKIVKYLDFVGSGFGFNVVRGSCLTILEPVTEKEQLKIDSILGDHGRRFHRRLSETPYPVPTLSKLMLFRMARTSIRTMLDETYYDYLHYRDKGWFESEYFYPARLNFLQKTAGNLFDYTAAKRAKK